MGVLFALVALILAAQVYSELVRPLPRLHEALAACDLPVTGLAWFAALSSAHGRIRAQLVGAAVSLTVVATIVVGDLLASRLTALSFALPLISTRQTWLLADVGNVLALALLGSCSIELLARPNKRTLTTSLGVLLALRGIGAGMGATLGKTPWPLRLADAALFLFVAWLLLGAAGERRTSAS